MARERARRPAGHFGTDEIGKTARVANLMREKLAATVASYERARRGLQELIGQVRASADGDEWLVGDAAAHDDRCLPTWQTVVGGPERLVGGNTGAHLVHARG